jgi:hypothetical protein
MAHKIEPDELSPSRDYATWRGCCASSTQVSESAISASRAAILSRRTRFSSCRARSSGLMSELSSTRRTVSRRIAASFLDEFLVTVHPTMRPVGGLDAPLGRATGSGAYHESVITRLGRWQNAVRTRLQGGGSVCGNHPPGAKAHAHFALFPARLKPCPSKTDPYCTTTGCNPRRPPHLHWSFARRRGSFL